MSIQFLNTGSFPDDAKLTFGTGSDLEIYHDGSHSEISESGTGDLRIRGDSVWILESDGTNQISAYQGTVKLYKDGVNRLETTSTGISVTGNINTSTDSSVFTGDGSTGVPLFLRSTSSVSYLQIQNSSTGTTGTNDGLTVGCNGTAGYIWLREAASLNIGTNDTSAITIDSSQNSTFAGNITLDDNSGNSPSLNFINGDNDNWYIDMLSSGKLRFVQGSTQRGIWSSGELELANNLLIPAGYVGRDAHNRVDFQTDDSIIIRVADTYRGRWDSTGLNPYGGSLYDLGQTGKRWANLWVDSINGATPAVGADYLPLAGGTMTGVAGVVFPDSFKLNLGTGSDLQIFHDAADSIIDNNVGHLYITQKADDRDIIFRSDDGSGGVETYFYLDGSASGGDPYTVFPDNSNLSFGDGRDSTIQHNGSRFQINSNGGPMYITQSANDGDLILESDNGSGGTETYFFLDGSTGSTKFPNNKKLVLGDSSDLRLLYDGSDSYIQADGTGHLYIQNKNTDRDIIFQSDDGSGGETTYFMLDGSAGYTTAQKDIRFDDGVAAAFGTGIDAFIKHSGSEFNIYNDIGAMNFIQRQNDGNMVFQSDDGSGGTATYFSLDGGSSATNELYTKWPDYSRIALGSGKDLQIYHDGNHSWISDQGTGNLNILTTSLNVNNAADTQNMIVATQGSSVNLYYNGTQHFRTISSGAEITGALSITGDGSNAATLTESGSGDFTIAAADDIRLDAGGNDIVLRGASSAEFGRLSNNSQDFIIKNITENKDIVFQGNDGNGGSGVNIDALKLDMSDSGWAHFNAGITVGAGTSTFAGKLTTADDITISNTSPEIYLTNTNAAKYNWMVAAQENVDQTFEITPSTAAGGSTYSTPALQINGSTSNATFAGDVTVNGTIKTLNTNDYGTIQFGSNASRYIRGNSAELQIGSTLNNLRFESTGANYIDSSTADGTTAFRINARTSHTSGNLFEVSNAGTTKLTVAYDGNTTFVGKAYGVTPGVADTDAMFATKGYVNTQITGATIYQGVWDPDVSLNSGYGNPDLSTAALQVNGYYYICSADGIAEPNGTGTEPDTWHTGDWVIWNDDVGVSGEWQKIDNTTVLSGAGTGEYLARWTDTETLGDSVVLTSGNDILIPQYIRHTSDPSDDTYFGFSANDTFTVYTAGGEGLNIDSNRKVTLTGVLSLPDGSVSAPSISNTGDLNTGIYWPGDHQLGFAVDGSRKFYMSATQAYFQNLSSGVSISAGGIDVTGDSTFAGTVSVTAADSITIADYILHSGDDSKFGFPSNDTFKIRTGGVDRFTLTNTDATFTGDVSVVGTGNATLILDSDSDNSGAAGSYLTFRDDGATKWVFYKETNNDLYVYNPGVGYPMHFLAGGDLKLLEDGNDLIVGTLSSGNTSTLTVNHEGGVPAIAAFKARTNRGHISIADNDTTGYITAEDSVLGFGFTSSQSASNLNILSSGNVGINTTTPAAKLEVVGGIIAGGKTTYTIVTASLTTTGTAVAGVSTGTNGQSSGFIFTCFGGDSGYQRIIYSCKNVSGTWDINKDIDEGANGFDVTYAADGSDNITFTFKSRSGVTQYYAPKVTVEAIGDQINQSYIN